MSLHQIPGHYIVSTPGEGGIDSATCSAIASSYAESAVSAASSNYYTTANESGYALSSDVSATVDLVGTQSANWGGSALALSAGPGVKLEKVGDTLVASQDRTLLWSGSAHDSITLTELPTNFESILVFYNATPGPEDMGAGSYCFNPNSTDRIVLENNFLYQNSSDAFSNLNIAYLALRGVNSTSWEKMWGGFRNIGTTASTLTDNYSFLKITDIYGINRTAEV